MNPSYVQCPICKSSWRKTQKHVCVCACVRVCMYVCMHACMHAHSHTHTYTHMHTRWVTQEIYLKSGCICEQLVEAIHSSLYFRVTLETSPNVFNLSSFIWKTEHSSITQEVFHLLYEAVVRPHIQYYPVSGSLTRRKTRPHQTSPVTWHEPENKRITVLQQTERI